MSAEVLQVANSKGLWAIAILIVAIVLFQSMLYLRLSFKVASEVGYPREKCVKALRVGLISAIGPSIAVFIVMVGMMSVVGTPITWLRLSVIGAAPTELTAATLGAKAVGVEFGSPQYDLYALSSSFWTMAINGTGWLIITALFTHRLESIRQKAGGGDARWLAVLSGAAALGCFGYLNANTVNGVIANVAKALPAAMGPLYALVGGLVGMVVITRIAEKVAWLREYTLGIAMLIGMAVAACLV